jgi:SGNH hydrolase-like domain, acetyltransferase AlgX
LFPFRKGRNFSTQNNYPKHFRKKSIIFALPIGFVVALLFPHQYKKLNGVTEPASAVDFSLKTWWEGSFQENKSDYLANNYAARPFAVRLYNQIDYTFFGKIHAKGVVEGKNKELYGDEYLDSFCGKDFEAKKVQIEDMASATDKLQDYLKARGKHLLVVIAPGKASFDPKNKPTDHTCFASKRTVYQHTINQFKTKPNIDYIDLVPYFKAQKEKSLYPLFTAYGVHWSKYGAVVAFDTVSHYIAKRYGQALPTFKIPSVRTTCDCSTDDTDCDLSDLMNLALPKKLPTYRALPNIVWDTIQKPKMNVLFVTDSFMWTWVGQNPPQNTFENYYFWFYNSDSWDKKGANTKVADLDIKTVLDKTDLVVFLDNETQGGGIGHGFTQNVLKLK